MEVSKWTVKHGVKRERRSSSLLPSTYPEKRQKLKELSSAGLSSPVDSNLGKEYLLHKPMTFESVKNAYITTGFLGRGTFGVTYRGMDSKTKQEVAIKVEASFVNKLKFEQEVYNLIRNVGEWIAGIPKFLDYGTAPGRNFIVLELLGPSLAEQVSSMNGTVPEKAVAAIGMQLIRTLKSLHQEIGLIHADVKPSNVVIGLQDNASKVYLVDYGCSIKYKNMQTGIRVHEEVKIAKVGTLLFMSETAHKLQMLGPRDDLISLSYMMAILLQGSLPWTELTYESQEEKWLKTRDYKANICPGDLFDGHSYNFVEFLSYLLDLSYWQPVNYDHLTSLLGEICENREEVDWKNIIPVPFRTDLYTELSYSNRTNDESSESSTNHSTVSPPHDDL